MTKDIHTINESSESEDDTVMKNKKRKYKGSRNS